MLIWQVIYITNLALAYVTYDFARSYIDAGGFTIALWKKYHRFPESQSVLGATKRQHVNAGFTGQRVWSHPQAGNCVREACAITAPPRCPGQG